MEYQKIVNLLDNASNQLSKFRRKNWVEMNDESKESYSANSNIIFKTIMLRSNLCNYADSYIPFKGTITIIGAGADAASRQADESNKSVIFKNCAPFTICISRINVTDIHNTQDIGIVMLKYNLTEYSDNRDDPNNDVT